MKLKQLSAATCVLALAGLAQAQQPVFDIVGVRLGMTEAEATAALKAHDATLKFTTTQGAYNYTDGVKQFQTPPFTSRIDASKPTTNTNSPDFILLFTAPPGAVRLWAIERNQPIRENQPSQAQYTEALKQKYGAPTAASRAGAALSWDFPAGKPSCLRMPNDAGFPQWRPSSGDLAFILKAGQQNRRAPADLSTCASQLYYVLSSSNGQVISSFRAILVDVPAFATSEAAASRHVEALEAQVRKAREGQGKAPAL